MVARSVVAVAVVAAAATAHADPAPSATPAEPWDLSAHLELAAHGGVAVSDLNNREFTTRGTGPAGELEGALRIDWASAPFVHIALSGYVDAAAISQAARHDRILGLGTRWTLELWGAVIGGGFGGEAISESGSIDDVQGPTRLDDTTWFPVWDFHAGYTLPKLGPVAIQALAIVQWEAHNDGDLTIGRFELGVVF
jgi:hypothetical protein